MEHHVTHLVVLPVDDHSPSDDLYAMAIRELAYLLANLQRAHACLWVEDLVHLLRCGMLVSRCHRRFYDTPTIPVAAFDLGMLAALAAAVLVNTTLSHF